MALAALTLLGAAAATMPRRGQETKPPQPGRVAVASPRPARVRIAAVPRRDPFAGGYDAPPAPHASAAVAIPPLPPVPRALPLSLPIVPQRTRDAFASRVTAIVTGTHPSALVETASETLLVTPGSRIDGEEVVAIELDGVHLASGTTLPLQTPEPDRSLRGGP